MNRAARAERRRQNLADHYNSRQAAAGSERELAGVMWDYARGIATGRAESADDPVWRELAALLHTWCQRQGGHSGHGG
ncbi:hypothetical protein SAMN06297387_12850 [Streptomyces zhaozhouensis]|uniref:Uncharacterized protein n=1 Tax=Streptomyces zhaozhouensis TaxID=1300267 RepID=A0A286E881_9ACTN|nr:hypothetical protein [Streptomyces zhaozhouensis]SOD67064.1 hypothetical protein SAMN06297387_12850 [Streptomyces zhaozhouensis]